MRLLTLMNQNKNQKQLYCDPKKKRFHGRSFFQVFVHLCQSRGKGKLIPEMFEKDSILDLDADASAQLHTLIHAHFIAKDSKGRVELVAGDYDPKTHLDTLQLLKSQHRNLDFAAIESKCNKE